MKLRLRERERGRKREERERENGRGISAFLSLFLLEANLLGSLSDPAFPTANQSTESRRTHHTWSASSPHLFSNLVNMGNFVVLISTPLANGFDAVL